MGLGLTSMCNLGCQHCYSRGEAPSSLALEDVRKIVEALPITALNLGTGENGLHPNIGGILDYLHDSSIKLSLTSNGYSVNVLDEKHLRYFHDIDISIDFPTRRGHDAFRGPGAFDTAIRAIERCLAAGVKTSIVACMMNTNYQVLPGFFPLIDHYGVSLRINVYKPVRTDRFSLTYDEFWQGIRNLFLEGTVVALSEGVVNAVTGIPSPHQDGHCGTKSFRIRPDGQIVPCVYWPSVGITIRALDDPQLNLEEVFARTGITRIPRECQECDALPLCKAGCAARRFYHSLEAPDPYCAVVRGDDPGLRFRLAPSDDFVHAGYLCTIILGT
ncbi:MAG: radical SAM protein [Bacteroidota bacterium]